MNLVWLGLFIEIPCMRWCEPQGDMVQACHQSQATLWFCDYFFRGTNRQQWRSKNGHQQGGLLVGFSELKETNWKRAYTIRAFSTNRGTWITWAVSKDANRLNFKVHLFTPLYCPLRLRITLTRSAQSNLMRLASRWQGYATPLHAIGMKGVSRAINLLMNGRRMQFEKRQLRWTGHTQRTLTDIAWDNSA